MDLKAVREELEELKANAMERKEKLARHVEHREEPLSQDFAEQAVEMENDETMVALADEMNAVIHDATRALQKLDDGTYGQCEECGENISEERLAVLPAAALCIDCAS